MGHQIIQQPDGQLAVFSTVVDAWVLYNATPESLGNYYAVEAARGARERVEKTIAHVLAGEPQKAYFQFTMTFEEADEESGEHGGTLAEMIAEGGVPWDPIPEQLQRDAGLVPEPIDYDPDSPEGRYAEHTGVTDYLTPPRKVSPRVQSAGDAAREPILDALRRLANNDTVNGLEDGVDEFNDDEYDAIAEAALAAADAVDVPIAARLAETVRELIDASRMVPRMDVPVLHAMEVLDLFEKSRRA